MKNVLSWSPLALIVMFAAVTPARAGSFTYSATGTVAGSPTQGLSATAVVTTNAGSIDIALTNNENGALMVSDGQAISGIKITLDPGASGLGSGSSSSGQLIDVNSNGTVTNVSGNPDRWITGAHLTVGPPVELLVLGGGTPNELIIGNPIAGAYPNANGGLTNGNFNPYVEGTGSFHVVLTGVTTGTSVTGVTFLFNTQADQSLVGHTPTPPSSPEPSTLLGMGTAGVVGLFLARRRRRNAV